MVSINDAELPFGANHRTLEERSSYRKRKQSEGEQDGEFCHLVWKFADLMDVGSLQKGLIRFGECICSKFGRSFLQNSVLYLNLLQDSNYIL